MGLDDSLLGLDDSLDKGKICCLERNDIYETKRCDRYVRFVHI